MSSFYSGSSKDSRNMVQGDDNASPKSIRGTREWAVAEINCSLGCPHGCRNCYARYDLVERKHRITHEQWATCRVIEQEVTKERPLFSGQVMFPMAHDIVAENLEASICVLKNLLAAGNKVLAVCKPHRDCMKRLCSGFLDARERLLLLYRELHNIPQLRWKESMKEVVGLRLVEEPGLDI